MIASPKLRRATVAVLLAGTALGGYAAGHESFAETPTAPAATTAATPAPGPIQPAPVEHALPDFANLAAQVRPAVVSVTAMLGQREQATPMGMQAGMMEARGSGFLIAADGTIVTNNHVVRNAEKVTVTLADGTTLPAKVLGRDSRTDLAVLKIDAGHTLPFVQLGNSSATRPGEWVVAIGNPFGLGGTVTAGIISAEGRNIGAGPYDEFIQVDAPINKGNSGGPLITQDGKVVGVNTAIMSPTGGSVGIGFAIPSNLVRNVVDQLRTTGHVTRGYLGVTAQPVTTALAPALHLKAGTRGALVAAVSADSPAAKAGLKPGDVIQSVNGTSITSPRDLAIDIAGLPPGKSATLAVARDGNQQNIDVAVAALPGSESAQGQGQGQIGVALARLEPQLRDQLGLPESANGAVVAEVKPGSPAELAGLRPGDLIVGVGPAPVSTPAEAVHQIHAATRDGKVVALRIVRDGRALFVAVSPEQGATHQG